MKTLFTCLILFLGLIAGDVLAGEIREIRLNDGSLIYGEVLSLSKGLYTLKTPSLGTIEIEESKIRSIVSMESSKDEINALQEQMIKDEELLNIINSLQNDPDFQRALEDPSILEAVNSGDINALLSNPKFIKLLNNPKILDIRDKIEK